jgi:thioredoxin reductase (NADPH)
VTHTPNIELVPKSKVVALRGDDMLRAVTVRNCETGEERTIETSFLFLCLGGVPNTQWAKEVGIIRDEQGYLVTGPDLRKFGPVIESWKLNREPYYLETSMPGVFAAGDVRHGCLGGRRRRDDDCLCASLSRLGIALSHERIRPCV